MKNKEANRLAQYSFKTQALVGIGGAVTVIAGCLIFQLLNQGWKAETALKEIDQSIKNESSINKINLLFKGEIQAWKDILIRGEDPANLKKYSEELDTFSQKIGEQVDLAKRTLDQDDKKLLEEFHSAQQELTQGYHKAKTEFFKEGSFDPKSADKALKGKDRKVLDSMALISKNIEEEMGHLSASTLSELRSSRNWAIGISLLLTVLVLSLAAWFVSRFSLALSTVSDGMAQSAQSLLNASEELGTSSQTLANSSTESAAALQETASSIDEVSAMIQRNSDYAKQAQQTSSSGKDIALQGKQSVSDMIASVQEIQKSNVLMVDQMKSSNQEIAQIIQLISAIGDKTKVINDIVFQTKLLSFNASVEAARAGEHGKGFAVVAEEVGNLAQMSGNAAKEISTMLDNSIKQVQQIIQTAQNHVDAFILEGRDKIESGRSKAERCGEVLDQVLTSVQSIAEMVEGITSASQEQSRGTAEITKAINELNQVTDQNSTISQQTAQNAVNFSDQSRSLSGLSGQLMALVHGQSEGGSPSIAQVHSIHSQKKGSVKGYQKAA